MAERIPTYREFWPHYVREHTKPATRNIHFAGTALATGSLITLIASGNLWFLPAALLGGYGPAWIAHFFIEHNRPATFIHPLWSLISDYRMAWLWLAGRLEGELAKAGVPPR
ncbi:MAG TPA: DUF962 domain-containing protein [Rhizomicrobium sp.]|nr:DUF962 domain-containing protein [Rhizomicrobium sp.]